MTVERFVVDAHLLRELGSRLVGQPHIALAELIKNSYDADARHVELHFESDRLVIVDDGHGMSHQDFSDRWLVIGTTVKEEERESPELHRPFTGSKGVGRLSVQLLARNLQLRTVGLVDPSLSGRQRRMSAMGSDLHQEVVAAVDWEKAITAGKIGDVEVEVTESSPSTSFVNGSPCGTELVLTGLTHTWDAERFRDLARELWPLQPPFEASRNDDSAFEVSIFSPYEDVVSEFNSQMEAILDIWTARVEGALLPAGAQPTGPIYELQDRKSLDSDIRDEYQTSGKSRYLQITLHVRRGVARTVNFLIPHCHIDQLAYEIRIFSLQHRQPRGLKVETARQYLLTYGGVHIYDANFHLPYYGPDTDWLRLERDNARRISASRLLPSDLQVSRGMLDLAPNTRLYGTVQISTTHEAEFAVNNGIPGSEVLTVQITRDRLADNAAFNELAKLVRASMDWYAMETARAKFTSATNRRSRIERKPSSSLRETGESLRSMRDQIPNEVLPEFSRFEEQIDEAIADSEAIERAAQTQAELVGALATAGMTALAYEHEISKQVATMIRIANDIATIANRGSGDLKGPLSDASGELKSLAQRMQQISGIFAFLRDEETRTSGYAGRVYALIDELARALEVLSRGTKIDYDKVSRDLRFPEGGYAGWWAIIQNLILNVLNATLDAPQKTIQIDSSNGGSSGWIRIQDTGVGIDLDDAERMFEAFERGQPVSRGRAELVLGGTGLGLTIVRMIAREFDVRVRFEKPEAGFNTAVRIAWKH